MTQAATRIFYHVNPKIIEITFGFLEILSPLTRVATPISDHADTKNQAISSIHSKQIDDLKLLQSDWPTSFWPKSQKPDFSQRWDLFRKKSKLNKFSLKTKFGRRQ